MSRLLISLVAVLAVSAPSAVCQAAESPRVEQYLIKGELARGERELTQHLKDQPKDAQARFGLGVLQALAGIEHLAQALYKYGALSADNGIVRNLPFLRLPVPVNPKPAKITYADFRKIFENLIADLAKAEATLAGVDQPDVKLPLRFGLIRLDLNGDGNAEEAELLWRLYAAINRGAGLTEAEVRALAPDAAGFAIHFDQGDVHWLRGYCHLLMAMCEAVLAYDQERLFATLGHRVFADSQPRPPLTRQPDKDPGWEDDIADAIAFIHLVDFPVRDAKRGEAALKHLEAVIAQSRLSWKAIEAETDDDREWVPNAAQKGVIPGVRVSQEMIAGWHEFLKEAELILAGKKLVPHYFLTRQTGGRGFNLRKAFLEPQRFDLVLWLQGTAALPYLEKGELTSQETWNRLERVFRGEFIGFAFWFN